MHTIVVGRFDGFEAAERMPARLQARGHAPSSIRVFVELRRGRGMRRPVCVAVAVRIDTPSRAAEAIALLESAGAASVEERLGDGSANDWHEDRAVANGNAWRSVAALLQPAPGRRQAAR